MRVSLFFAIFAVTGVMSVLSAYICVFTVRVSRAAIGAASPAEVSAAISILMAAIAITALGLWLFVDFLLPRLR